MSLLCKLFGHKPLTVPDANGEPFELWIPTGANDHLRCKRCNVTLQTRPIVLVDSKKLED